MYTGWILFFYACTHLLNHSFGILGLDALDRARTVFIAFWRLPVLEWVVVASAFLHFIFVAHKLFTRPTYKGLSGIEWTQIVLGLLIVDALTNHVMETRITHELFNVEDSYTYYIFWTPGYYWVLFMLLIGVLWTHGVIGMRSYIKQKSWFPKWQNWLAGTAVGLPILAFCGIINAIQEVGRLAEDPVWVAELQAASNPRGIDLVRWSESWSYSFSGLYLVFLALFFGLRKIALFLKKKRSGVVVKYLEGAQVSVARGTSLLEASIIAKIPHAHVCGGRGRCSTCRVQVIEGIEFLPPPSNDELALLRRIKGGQSIRLACRTRPVSNVTIYPLLLPNVSLKHSLWRKAPTTGLDRDVAILFADLRGFTSLSEDKLPYDVVFVLNQYFQIMGHAVEAHNGRIDKFIGDAIMAVFGTQTSQQQACRDALSAVRNMRFQLDRLNAQLKNELHEPLKMGFGVHSGHVIIGEMGYKDSNNLVAIGDATNTTSRLESLTKDFDCELIVSKDAIDCAGLDFSQYPSQHVEIRGKSRPLEVYTVKDVKEMYAPDQDTTRASA